MRRNQVLGLGLLVPVGILIILAAAGDISEGNLGGLGVVVLGLIIVGCGGVVYREGAVWISADAIYFRRMFRTRSVPLSDVASIYLDQFRLDSGLRAERVALRTRDAQVLVSGFYSIVSFRKGTSSARLLAERLDEYIGHRADRCTR